MRIPSFAILLFFLFSAVAIWAQQTATSQISGLVTDPTGAAVAGADVKATQTETQFVRTVTSGPDGRYVIPNLAVGPYQLQVSASGFATYVQSGIILQVNVNPEINASLRVGGVAEQVQVTADVAMAETHENSIAQLIDQRRIIDLPLNGRQATQLILLSGASAVGPPGGNLTAQKTYPSSTPIAVAGSQPNTTNYLMDGGDNNDNFSNINMPFPFPDALQEFNVQTSALPARYGLHSGAVVSLVTKSGSNGIHGDLFEFLRNGDLNARNFFAPVHDALKRNQFGGTIGGPVLKNKLFFFGGYQGTRVRTDPTTTFSYVPNQQMLNGDFTTFASSQCQAKPFTLAAPFQGNRISPSLFNQQALNVLQHIPLSTDPCGQVQYGIPNNSAEDQVIGRIDFNQSEKHTLFGRYFISDYRNPASGESALTTTKAGIFPRSQSLTIGDNYLFGPATINSFRATGTRLRVSRGPASNFFDPTSVGININSLVPDFTYLTVSNYFALGCGNCSPGHFNSNAIHLADDIDLIRGSHQISFGVDYIHNQLNDLSNVNSNGVITFNGQITGNNLADFMLGRVGSFLQANPQANNVREDYVGLYVQDSWKLRPRLTLNAGLRWEPSLPSYDVFGRGAGFSMANFLAGVRSVTYPNAPPGALLHGDPGFPSQANSEGKLADFAPRVGLVFDRTGNGKETIRVSYGIFYDWAELQYDDRVNFDPPFGNSISLNNPPGGLTNPYQGYPGGNPFPQGTPPPKNIAFPTSTVWVTLPPNLKPTYVQQWNVSWQRQITGNWLVSASYVGNKTSHLWAGTDLNPAVYIPGSSTLANTNARRVLSLLNPAYGAYFASVAQTDDGANANFEGLLTSLQHRFSHNFTLIGNYTFSHCISETEFGGDISGPTYQNPNNRTGDRGNCAYDHRHVFNTSVVASTPNFSSNRMLHRLAGGWQISGILSASSGGFWNVTTGKDNSLTGINLDRPNVVGDVVPSNRSFVNWFSSAAFQANATGTYGNAGRNILEGPSAFNLDMGLVREFAMPFKESHRLQVRAEAFNIMNHANLDTSTTGTIHLSLSDSKLGQITGAADPRILQFALKYVF